MIQISAFEAALSLSCQAGEVREGILAARKKLKHSNSFCAGKRHQRSGIEKLFEKSSPVSVLSVSRIKGKGGMYFL